MDIIETAPRSTRDHGRHRRYWLWAAVETGNPASVLVSNDEMNKFMLFNIQKDWKEENDLATSMPEKLEEMKKELFKVWKEIETEGPKEWWLGERNKPMKGAKLNY